DMPDTKEERMSTPSNIFRTTFHPDYDYSNFVGSYKPVMRKSDDVSSGDEEKRELEYAFVPQVFTKAYIRAYKSKNDDSLSASEKQVYLIIEEINRGNCAQIFGDLFQLLDRKDGVSEYPVVPDTELINYLNEHGIPGNSIRLPENLHILATMNTSDQSLFPMDSAFKRRWAMEYIPINLEQEKAKTFTFKVKGVDYSWVEFLAKVNPLIRKATDSEDKQMGEFFIKESVSEEDFKNKVMFYIWNDVCKDLYSASRISPLFFMRSADGDDRKDVFTFAELFGSGRYNEEANDYTLPSDLLEGFIKNYLKLTPKTAPAPDAE
ncbi:MAG: AAA family ATPase, partial [Candidatus Cryptobacteroides sp.]|nr:AAA family ATPase [Bacteroidales bacterium]MDY5495440.1 AAA family ATPase [Candidatus Cryptobacteroides sp.]